MLYSECRRSENLHQLMKSMHLHKEVQNITLFFIKQILDIIFLFFKHFQKNFLLRNRLPVPRN